MDINIKEIKRRLKAVGYNPTSLCKMAKVDRSTFYRWENGTKPTKAVFSCFMSALDNIEGSFLERLLKKPKLWKNTKILPEQEICIEFVDKLRQASLDGRLNAVWWHNVNEGKRSKKSVALLKQTGMVAGVADYVFCWKGGSGVIEMKSKRGVVQPNQHDFKRWCDSEGVKHAYCRSAMEGLKTLDKWGVLNKKNI